MSHFYQKPENAVKRAEELLSVHQQASALTLLHEVLLSKRARASPIGVLEPIILKFIELAVQLGKGKIVREVLFTYKNIVQNTTVVTIELVIKRYIELAENKLAEAQATADKINLDAVDDLEASETPESILMSTVSTDDSKDRTDRAVVTPWMRFLWEAYRTALDTLRNNARLEILYQHVANQAFGFCLKYTRKTEFRRLCEILRSHLITASKYANQAHSIDLNDAETLQRHLDIRFVQLNAAAELEHWHEGFRSIEDIHNLLELSKKTPKAYMMANYYEKLARIFMVGENYLFHAAALNKYYSIMRQNKNLSREEHERIATSVLISALSIPIISSAGVRSSYEVDENKIRAQRLTTLLRVSQPPTRESLLKEALGKNVFPMVRAEVKDLYKSLEVDFHPLSICKKIAPTILAFSETADLSRYAKLLHQVILTRLLQQLSQVYSTIKIESVVQLASLPAPYNVDAHAIEKFVMNGCKRGELSIRVNHQSQTLTFQTDLFAAGASSTPGPRLQNRLPTDSVRLQLSRFAQRLHVAVGLVQPKIVEDRQAAKLKAFKDAAAYLEEERQASFMRRALIEKKKEMRENEIAEKEREEQRLKALRLQQEQAAEKIRMEEEAKRREIERMAQQRQEIEKIEAQKMAEKLASELGEKNAGFNRDDLMNMDKNSLVQLQVQQLEKERRELLNKTKALLKRVDHTERAFRKEEIPLLKKDFEDQQKHDREAFAAGKAARLEAAKAKHAEDMKMKKSLSRVLDDYIVLRDELQAKRDAEFKEQQAAAARSIKAAKEKRVKEMRSKFEAERERRIQELEDKARREEEERIRLEQAAAEAEKARQAAEARKAEEEERLKRLDEIARKQREREAEIEARRQQQQQQQAAPSAARRPEEPSSASWRRPAPPTPAAPPSTSAYRPPARREATYQPPIRRDGPGETLQPSARRDGPSAPSQTPMAREGSWGASRPLSARAEPPNTTAPPAGGPPRIAPGSWREREAAKRAAAEAAEKSK
ncbi:eukaryotic translation initiation factor 3 subunit A [Polyrhizophydium stewartii]|uniref:Eukaryotic translation initiation factor 3 subunit A n=1 Tax=Polyrhizophydium stewartii TaxID=2732419 RepID=A0ABR4NB93_9FUNG|nr:eukaryotic translation initiation factor 3 subunit A [Polyrhizophydium stewartii]